MKNTLITLASVATLTGCTFGANHVEDDFGQSVRQMVAAQIFDPATAANPDPDAPLILDGDAATQAILGYREDAKREDRLLDKSRLLDPQPVGYED